MNSEFENSVEKDLRLCESLFSTAARDREHWEKIVRLVMPERLESADLDAEGHRDKKERICGHAQIDVLKLASAHGTYITPIGQKWFQYAPWYDQDIDESEWVKEESWYSKNTEITHAELQKSNFYTEIYSVNLDRSLPGTGLMLAEGDIDTPLTFTHIPAGTFALAENSAHEVCTVVRKLKMTAAQMVTAFGIEALSENSRKDLEDETRRYSALAAHTVYHLVEPNPRGLLASGGLRAEERAFRSVYIDVTDRHYLFIGGYYEFPYFATRFNRYGNSPYGRSPLAGVIDDIRDLISLKYFNFINAQKKTMPPVLISAEIEGNVDLRAGGKTIVSYADVQAGLPREWGLAGDIRDSLEQIEEKKKAIDDATFVSIIQAVTQAGKSMTATEVNSIESEKILTFSPSFMQYVTDFRPMMDRIFCILVRQGKISLDDAPESVKASFEVQGKLGGVERVLPPNISYIGMMAQTIKQVQQNGLNQVLNELITLARETENPEWIYPINEETTARWKMSTAAIPYRCINSPEKVEAKRRAREEQARAIQEAQLAQQQSIASRNFAQANSM